MIQRFLDSRSIWTCEEVPSLTKNTVYLPSAPGSRGSEPAEDPRAASRLPGQVVNAYVFMYFIYLFGFIFNLIFVFLGVNEFSFCMKMKIQSIYLFFEEQKTTKSELRRKETKYQTRKIYPKKMLAINNHKLN